MSFHLQVRGFPLLAAIYVKDQAMINQCLAPETRAVPWLLLMMGMLIIITGGGCAVKPKQLRVEEINQSFPAGSIISAKAGALVSFETLMADLATVQVIYVGESHTQPEHHQIQLQVLQALFERFPGLSVGMEMFDRTYQPRLDQWSAGNLDEKDFLRNVHWYANWRFGFRLYRDILDYIKTNQIPLVGLNLPFHIPPKISVGGLDSLSPEEKRHLPATIDLTDAAHREYVQKAFSHHHIPGRNDFQDFYAAQCAWEDTMAAAIADHLGAEKMVVLVGNGHIIRKFGIPKRAYQRTKADYRTIYLAAANGRIKLSAADYIWVTVPEKRMGFGAMKHPAAKAD